MKFVSGILLVAVWVGTGMAASSSVRIDGAEFDFGQMPSNSTVMHRVWIHSTGSDTLLLADLKTGCGCLGSTGVGTRILPGDSASILLFWQTRGLLGPRAVSAFLFLEPEPLPYEIRLKGKAVTPSGADASLVISPAVVTMKAVPKRTVSMPFQMNNKTETDLILKTVETGPFVSIDVPTVVDKEQRAQGLLTVDVLGGEQPFESSITIELEGNHTAPFRVTIPVVCGDFSFRHVFTTKEK